MAIAFVGAADGGNASSASSLTYSYTCGAGSNRLLCVALLGDATSDLITGVTYGGVAMTLVDKNTAAATTQRWQYLYYLLAPATGANNVVVSASGTCDFLISGAADYSGVAQAGQPDATTKQATTSTVTNVTTSITTVTDNAWAILVNVSYEGNNPPTAGTGATRRTFDAAFGAWSLFDSGGLIHPAGSYSMNTTRGGASSNGWGHVIGAFSPAASGIPNKVYQTNFAVKRAAHY